MATLLKHLATGSNYSIDAYARDDYSHYIQITKLPTKRVLQTFPFDPTDRTVTGVILPATLKALGEHAPAFMDNMAQVMPKDMGAKEFFVIPGEQKLTGYCQPEEPEVKTQHGMEGGFGRMRQCDRANLVEKTGKLLEFKEYQQFTRELDEQNEFLLNEADLVKGRDPLQRYAEIDGILEKARFTADKQAEYKKEELQGKMSRFKSEYVMPVVMVNKKTGQIRGLVRGLQMGADFAYLSDEVMDQELLDFRRFPGDTEQQKKENRETFLLAYLMNKAGTLSLSDHKQLFIVAADKREHIYEGVGFEKFPMTLEGWRLVLKRCPEGPVITLAKERIKALAAATVKAVSSAWKYGAVGLAALAVTGLAMFLSSKRGAKAAPSLAAPVVPGYSPMLPHSNR